MRWLCCCTCADTAAWSVCGRAASTRPSSASDTSPTSCNVGESVAVAASEPGNVTCASGSLCKAAAAAGLNVNVKTGTGEGCSVASSSNNRGTPGSGSTTAAAFRASKPMPCTMRSTKAEAASEKLRATTCA